MKGKGIGLLSLKVLLLSLCWNTVSTEQDKCPNIRVTKNQIIFVKPSISAGAEFLLVKKLPSARECYQLCCDNKGCDLAQVQYKTNTSTGAVDRFCYLFKCGHPSKCSFQTQDHHATIRFAEREKPSQTKSGVNSNRPQVHKIYGGCLPGVPEAMCMVDPCVTATCAADQYATCRPSFCGFCHAEFVDDDGVKVDCNGVDKNIDPEEKDLLTKSEQGRSGLGGKVGHGRKMSEVKKKTLSPTKYPPVKTTMETILIHPDESGVDKFSFEEFEKELHKFTAKPTTKPTTRPTTRQEPTTFHHWRQFVDNNPNFPPPTHKEEVFPVDWERRPTPKIKEPSTERVVPAEKHTPVKKEPTVEVTQKEPVPSKKELPTKKERPHSNRLQTTIATMATQEHDIAQIHPIIQSELHKNVSDVVLIENNHLKIVENKAVLPLAVFLVVAILLLFVVALRLKVVKNKLRRRPFATDDADYLINGMYL